MGPDSPLIHLLEDFTGCEVSLKAHLPGGTEHAAHCAAHLVLNGCDQKSTRKVSEKHLASQPVF
jgi:hypothetical protein